LHGACAFYARAHSQGTPNLFSASCQKPPFREIVRKWFFSQNLNSLAAKEFYFVFRIVRYLSVGGAWRMSRHLFQWDLDPTVVEDRSKPRESSRFRDSTKGEQ
jgi:hypothetical protein